MIEIVFTLDYEIYGNGEGSLRELVYEPAQKLNSVFGRYRAPIVVFVEVAELEIIEAQRGDQAIDIVKHQLREFRAKGFELGLHLHPQWYNARYVNSEWQLDYHEYNLCTLSPDRINIIIGRSLEYLRTVLEEPGFTPVSFRAGNWLLQPTRVAAKSLAEHGIKVDSSIYKGGLQHAHKLDYRRSQKNGYYWRFSEDVNVPDSRGILLEIPTYTTMVPLWNMFTAKRIGLQQRGAMDIPFQHQRILRLRDFLRPCYPMKLDFCRLTAAEMIRVFDKEIEKDREQPASYRPIVAIGHTKDLVDIHPVEEFLLYLHKSQIEISTFSDVSRIIQPPNLAAGE